MTPQQLEILEILICETNYLDENSLDVAEKILFEGATISLDALERQTFEIHLKGFLEPSCIGANGTPCQGEGEIAADFIIDALRSGLFLCEECLTLAQFQRAS